MNTTTLLQISNQYRNMLKSRGLSSVLNRVRKNHALEHATIHILSEESPYMRLAGRSDHRGFTLYGDMSSEIVSEAAAAALRRVRAGERHLAVHPNCGTNLVTAGLLGSLAGLLSNGSTRDGWRGRLERLPFLIVMITIALIVAQPIGLIIQRRVTTNARLGDMEIVSVKRKNIGALTLHRVETVI